MCAFANLDRRALPFAGRTRGESISSVVISSVHPIVAPAWPTGWEDVEVVDSVLVDEPPPAAPADPAEAGVYDRSGRRMPAFRRFGRIVDVLA